MQWEFQENATHLNQIRAKMFSHAFDSLGARGFWGLPFFEKYGTTFS
jgi:hypothetical protein